MASECTSSDVLGLKILTTVSPLLRGEDYDVFLQDVARYTVALRLELLDRMYQWAESRRDEEAQRRPYGQAVSPVEGVWMQVIEMVRLMKETLP